MAFYRRINSDPYAVARNICTSLTTGLLTDGEVNSDREVHGIAATFRTCALNYYRMRVGTPAD